MTAITARVDRAYEESVEGMLEPATSVVADILIAPALC